jgi:inner membrane protein
LRLISRPLAATIGNRGVTHSAVAVLVCLMILRGQSFHRAAIDPLVIGYLSHLAANLLTTRGVRLAWPSRRRQAIPLCRTGSFGESVIVTGAALWTGAAMLRLYPSFGM